MKQDVSDTVSASIFREGKHLMVELFSVPRHSYSKQLCQLLLTISVSVGPSDYALSLPADGSRGCFRNVFVSLKKLDDGQCPKKKRIMSVCHTSS